MAVNAKTVREVASLARLRVADSEIEILAEEMTAIMDLMGTIGTWSGVPDSERAPTIRRPDVPRDEEDSNLVSDAAHTENNSVVVPPIKGAS